MEPFGRLESFRAPMIAAAERRVRGRPDLPVLSSTSTSSLLGLSSSRPPWIVLLGPFSACSASEAGAGVLGELEAVPQSFLRAAKALTVTTWWLARRSWDAGLYFALLTRSIVAVVLASNLSLLASHD